MMSARMKFFGVGLAVAFATAIAAPSDAGQAVSKDGDHYHLDASVDAGCKVGAECTVTMKVVGKNSFHVNVEFPTTFKVAKSDAYEIVGAPVANVTEASGTVTAKVKLKTGNSINGTAKFAVCSNDKKQCEPNNVDVTVGL
jgi:hypothetical protein